MRLAEEICTLDALSGGRLELGVGRGVSPLETAAFGVDWDKAQAMYLEAFQVLMQALTSRSVSFRGEHYEFDDSPLILEPVQKPHRRSGTAPTPRHRLGGEPRGERRRNLTAARCPSPTAIAPSGRLPGKSSLLMMGINRHVVVAETDREAMDRPRAYRRWFETSPPCGAGAAWPKNIASVRRHRQERTGDRRVAADGALSHRAADGAAARTTPGAPRLGDLTRIARPAELFARRVMPEETAPAA